MKRVITIIATVLSANAMAQFAPQAGVSGTTAIPAGSSLFKSWATHCSVARGLQQVGNVSGGYASSGDSTEAIGPPNGQLVSLGDSGVAVLTFAHPIVDGPGPDFAVFENGFVNPANPEEAFLELAFVEVSSDGVHYTRFPATSHIQDTAQLSSIAGQNYTDARQLNNLAGKYVGGYGTPFDLQELAGTPGLDVNNITHVRVVDVIGAIDVHVCYDAFGHKVNDPYPTVFPTGGFDLDAVGVINQSATGIEDISAGRVVLYPNPASDAVMVSIPRLASQASLTLTDITGRIIRSGTITAPDTTLSLQGIQPGVYFISITDKDHRVWTARLYRQ